MASTSKESATTSHRVWRFADALYGAARRMGFCARPLNVQGWPSRRPPSLDSSPAGFWSSSYGQQRVDGADVPSIGADVAPCSAFRRRSLRRRAPYGPLRTVPERAGLALQTAPKLGLVPCAYLELKLRQHGRAWCRRPINRSRSRPAATHVHFLRVNKVHVPHAKKSRTSRCLGRMMVAGAASEPRRNKKNLVRFCSPPPLNCCL